MRVPLGSTVRKLPGGRYALDLRRRVAGELRTRRHPPRPPVEPLERAAARSKAPDDDAFITGNGIATHCRHVLNYDGFHVNEHVENDWWFCKADFLEYFFAEHAPSETFVLFSHNGDRPIGRRFRGELRRRSLLAWFAVNPALRHEKLRALPLGLANPYWPHGDQTAFQRVQAAPPPKRELFDVSFEIGTNPKERGYCVEQTGLSPVPRRPFEEYLDGLASAYFSLSPHGNGIDCLRTWESLYLRTIPVVTRSLVTDHHPDLPMIVLDDWSEFRSIDFSPGLYERTWGAWEPSELRLDRYLARVAGILRAVRSAR